MANVTADSYTASSGVRTLRLGRPAEPGPNDPGSPWLTQSALSVTLPASKTIGTLGTAILQSLAPGDTNAHYYLRRMLSGWGSGVALKLYNSSGQLVDIHYIHHGGGHSDSGFDGTVYFSVRTKQWYVAQAHTVYAPVAPPVDSTLLSWGESSTLRPASAHAYQHNFAVHSNETGGPAFHRAYAGGAWSTARSVSASHRMMWANKTWERIAQGALDGPTVHMVIKDRTRNRAVRWPVPDNRRDYYVHDYAAGTPTVQSANQTNFRGPWGWGDGNYPCGVHHEAADLYVAAQFQASTYKLMALNPANLAGDWVQLTTTGASIPSMAGVGIQYRSAAGTLLLVDASTTPPTGVFEITPPSSNPLSNPWNVVRHTFTGTSAFGVVPGLNPTNINDRFQYVSELDSLLVLPSDAAPMEIWRL